MVRKHPIARILLTLAAALLILSACAETVVGPDPAPAQPDTGFAVAAGATSTPTLAPLAPKDATATAIATQTPTATPTVAATPTMTPTPTATPPLSERAALAATAIQQGNRDDARSHLETLLTAESDSAEDARLYAELGALYLADSNPAEAIDPLTQALALDPTLADVHFQLGDAYAATGACADAIAEYEQYLAANPELAATVQPRIAACYDVLEDPESALRALQAAANADSHFLVRYSNRIALANRYNEAGRFGDAADVYRAIQRAARTDRTRGEMHYYIGNAMLLDGDTGGYWEYQQAVNTYPTLYTSYLALVALIEAGVPVDEFQRGVVDYYAGAYQPGVEAFGRYLEANPDDYDTHLYLAVTYEQLGDIDKALEELDTYAGFSVTTAPIGLYERGLLLQRQGLVEDAITTFRELAETIPQDENAPDAAWRAATLSERAGATEDAIALYRQVADRFPEFELAPEALFRAGLLAVDAQGAIEALETWEQAARLYPMTEYGQASLLWLLNIAPEQGALPSDLAPQPVTAWYYGLRVQDELDGVAPFVRQGAISVGNGAGEQAEAEAWLRDQLELSGEAPLTAVSAEWQTDPHRVRGEKLWRLGLFNEAKQEFFELRRIYRDDPLAQYQMALFFSDLGVYSQSIGAAERLMALTGANPFTAPPFIAKLAYPTYYADLILPLADEYGYDPLLQFALIRQESLYESFATSTAVAQGLAQVIPDTGQYIADKLGWTNYENADLYKPYVGLRFGGFYLAEQLDLFDGAAHAALAAYNAGPGNALNWYAEAGDDIDAYVETVNFAETRLYIERIYTGYVIYRALYGMQPTDQG